MHSVGRQKHRVASRFTAGVVLMVTLASCSGHVNPAAANHPAPKPDLSATPLAVSVVPVEESFSYPSIAHGPVTTDLATLTVTPGESTLLFPRPTFAPRCIAAATLVLPKISVTRSGGLAAYPSAARGFAKSRTPQVPGDLLNNRPWGDVYLHKGATHATVKVTELVKGWLSNDIRAGSGTAERGLPLMFTLQPPSLVGRLKITISNSAPFKPRLRISHQPNCP